LATAELRHNEQKLKMPNRFTSREKGFSLLEMMLATVILLVGLVAIAQLVPATILLNYRNRTDSAAMVFAQREMDFMLDQPLISTGFVDPLGVYCPLSTTCNLGTPAPPNAVQGSPLVVLSNQTLIDFSNPAGLGGWSFTYQDPNDPTGATYDIRWAVIISGNGVNISAKRFILGIRQVGGSGYFQPVTLDTMVQK
jgi:prepilin-type N-terminal cleavage/methylation domain-containing protein